MGLGTGYLIYGPQELRGYPERSKEVDWPTGLWGIALPGFLQFFTGAHDDPVGGLCIGLTGVYVSDVFATVKADLPPEAQELRRAIPRLLPPRDGPVAHLSDVRRRAQLRPRAQRPALRSPALSGRRATGSATGRAGHRFARGGAADDGQGDRRIRRVDSASFSKGMRSSTKARARAWIAKSSTVSWCTPPASLAGALRRSGID